MADEKDTPKEKASKKEGSHFVVVVEELEAAPQCAKVKIFIDEPIGGAAIYRRRNLLAQFGCATSAAFAIRNKLEE